MNKKVNFRRLQTLSFATTRRSDDNLLCVSKKARAFGSNNIVPKGAGGLQMSGACCICVSRLLSYRLVTYGGGKGGIINVGTVRLKWCT